MKRVLLLIPTGVDVYEMAALTGRSNADRIGHLMGFGEG